jgi:hypothetical protein
MSILSQLKNLSITPEQLAKLTSSDLIRIEKRLKAETAFNENLTINDVEDILFLLKNNKSELEFIYSDYFIFFRQLVESPNTLITFSKPRPNNLEFSDTFLEFISTYFEENINLYIANCFKEMHYNALFSLLFYHNMLNTTCQDLILKGLIEKIKYSIEAINIRPSGPFDDVTYLANPYFFRCITELESLSFQNDITTLMNLSIQNLTFDTFYSQILFSLGTYKTEEHQLKSLIAFFKTQAVQVGIREKHYPKHAKLKKGDTIVQPDIKLPQNSPQDTTYLSTIIKVIIGVFIIFLILITYLTNY